MAPTLGGCVIPLVFHTFRPESVKYNYNIAHYLVGQGLCEDKVLHRHVCFVFLPNPPIAILELPNCLSHESLTFLKRCYWFLGQEYNKHVTMKVLIST